jgi:glycosyltransferase involved in cell wall biosynthesis
MGPLIIGRVPEPNNIGGVGIFTSRLLLSSEFLRSHDYDFYSTKNKKPIDLVLRISRSSFVHFNGSSEFMMFAVALLCKLMGKRLILSIHAEVGRGRGTLRLLEKLAIKLAYIPVVGAGSYSKAIRINYRSEKASAFIPPSDTNDLYVDSIVSAIKGKKIFCTNANNFVFDSHGNEIYGVLFLVKYFAKHNDGVLVIVDSSGAYSKYFSGHNPYNVIFINQDIDFCHLLKNSDCFIRFTSTDGDSISVMESLFFKIPVIATDCITRPGSCIPCKYGDLQSLDHAINVFNAGLYKVGGVNSVLSYYDALYEQLSLGK